MQPGSVRPASLPYRLERPAKPRPVLWRATAARREVARCGRRRRDRSSSCRTNQLDSAELVIKMQGRHFDGDLGNGGWIRREASAELIEIWQSAGIEFSVDGRGEFGLAGTIMSERQQPNHGAARLLLAVTGQQRFEGALIGTAREELLTIDQVEQGHRLAAQGMDDMPAIDNMAVLAAGMRPPAAQAHQWRRAEEAFEPIIIEAYAQPMADQARGHRIEHFSEDEPAGRSDGDDGLLVIRRP